MKKNITITLLAVLSVVLLYLLLSDSCQQPVDSHKSEYDAVLRDRERLQRDSAEHAQKEAVLLKDIKNRDSVIKNQHVTQQRKEKELRNSKSTIAQLRTELQDFRNKDTGYVNIRIDSLLIELDKLTYLLDEYMAATDSLTMAIEQQRENYESLAAQRAQLLSDLRQTYSTVYNSYESLYKDYSKLNKRLRNEKLKTKIAAVIALVEGVLLIVK